VAGRRKAEPSPPPESLAPPSSKLSAFLTRISASKLAFELLVVFIGVTSAFWLEGWRQEQQRIEDARAVYSAIADEIRLPAETAGPAFQAEALQRLADWKARRAKGERPDLVYLAIDGAPRPPTGVWDAAVASGAIKLTDPHMMFCLARFYNRLKSVGDAFVKYDDFNAAEVMPYLGRPEAFYDSRGELKPQYEAQVQRLEKWTRLHGMVIDDARRLMPILRRGDARAACPLSN